MLGGFTIKFRIIFIVGHLSDIHLERSLKSDALKTTPADFLKLTVANVAPFEHQTLEKNVLFNHYFFRK